MGLHRAAQLAQCASWSQTETETETESLELDTLDHQTGTADCDCDCRLKQQRLQAAAGCKLQGWRLGFIVHSAGSRLADWAAGWQLGVGVRATSNSRHRALFLD
jgi:hypothetical protein